nr:hypothetical protein [Prolixibacteraceae bacterium]
KLVQYAQTPEDSVQVRMILEELDEYDHTYQQLCTDLNATPNDERVINALLTYYQTKLEILNRIVHEIESKQQKVNSHEDTRI